MTIQAGAEAQDEQATEQYVRALLTPHFQPEFLNRIDEIVVFRRLTRDQLRQIVESQLRRVGARLAESGYGLRVTDAAMARLAEVGYDPVYGARPLKRAIQRELQDPLALRLLAGDFKPGQTIAIDRGPDGLVFSSSVGEEAVATSP